MDCYFKPTAKMPQYRGHQPGSLEILVADKPGPYSWPDEKALQVCDDFPENFALDPWPDQGSEVKGDSEKSSATKPADESKSEESSEDGDSKEKAAGKPSSNRAAQPPDKNK